MTHSLAGISGYQYLDGKNSCSHPYLLPKVTEILQRVFAGKDGPKRLFDLGAGNGSVAAQLTGLGYEVTGVDPSTQGLAAVSAAHPQLRIEEGSCYEDLAGRFGVFPAVISLEVVEHLYAPREFAATVSKLLEPGGCAVISTPFHGYWKNLAIAALGKSDQHFNPLWDHGHIKFWSPATLRQLLEQAGFRDIQFHFVGRNRTFAKSMIAVARK